MMRIIDSTALLVFGALVAVFAAAAPGNAAGLESLDADRDGFVARAEFVRALRERFDRIDGDRNGRIARSEMRSFGMRQMTSANKDPVFSRDRKRPEIPFDGNGEVDFAAFSQAMLRQRFDPSDRDRDGRLSAAEIGTSAP